MSALGAGSSGFLADRRRAADVRPTQRSRRTLEPRGARELWKVSCDPPHRRSGCGSRRARDVFGRSASNRRAQRAAARRHLHTEPHPWPDGGDQRQSVRDPRAGRRPDRVRHDDLEAGGLSEPSVVRLSLGSCSRQHRGRGKARSTNAPTPILPPGGRSSCNCARRRAPTTKRSTRSSARSRSRCWPTARRSLCAATATSLSTQKRQFGFGVRARIAHSQGHEALPFVCLGSPAG